MDQRDEFLVVPRRQTFGDRGTHLAAVAVRAVAPGAGLLEKRASGRGVLRMQGHGQKRTSAECNRNSHGSFIV